MKYKSYLLKSMAFFLAGVLLFETAYAQPLAPLPAHSAAGGNPGLSFRHFNIPEDLGRVTDFNWEGPDHPFVILIQDAHAVIECQQKTQELLAYLQQNYNLGSN